MYKIFALILFLFTCSYSQEKLGKEITLEQYTEISSILEVPDSFAGKKVLIQGEILEVCKMAGCWMEISSGKENEKIKVKVKDGEIVFPVESIGKTAVVEGEVYKMEMDKERAIAYYEHIAEENDKEFDPSTVTGPVTLYQVKGEGVVILDKEAEKNN
ncbi:MAG: DUF4920 domain-containing protein [Ignavibacteriaceae bacterium]